MTKKQVDKIVKYFKAIFKRTGIPNVSIHLPGITDKEIKQLQPFFTNVIKCEVLGYVHFSDKEVE